MPKVGDDPEIPRAETNDAIADVIDFVLALDGQTFNQD
jgi:hypothetical protein